MSSYRACHNCRTGFFPDDFLYITVDEKKEKLLSCIGELDEKEKDVIIRRYYYEQKQRSPEYFRMTNASIFSSPLIRAAIIFLSFNTGTSIL